MNTIHEFHRVQEPIHSLISEFKYPSAISCLPQELILEIFSHLNAEELGRCKGVCREWSHCANDKNLWKKLMPKIAFGPQEWARYFGKCDKELPLPQKVYKILKSPCPFWPEKKVEETHLLVLVPQTIDGKPLTLVSLGELVKKPKEGFAAHYLNTDSSTFEEHGQEPAYGSYWVLMTKEVIPRSRAKTYANQQALLMQLNEELQVDYTVPLVLEAAICVFMHHVKTQQYLLSDEPLTYTHCQEQVGGRWQRVIIGCFSSAGLHVSSCNYVFNGYGLAPLRIFF